MPGQPWRYAGKLVLGKTHWTAASAEQRERFIEVFYSFLLRTYAKGVLEFDQAKLHLYGKKEARPGRKMGHVNCLGDTVEAAESLLNQVRDLLT